MSLEVGLTKHFSQAGLPGGSGGAGADDDGDCGDGD